MKNLSDYDLVIKKSFDNICYYIIDIDKKIEENKKSPALLEQDGAGIIHTDANDTVICKIIES